MRYATALIALALCGCQHAIKIDPPPKIVRTEVVRYIAIPAELDADCYNEPAKEQTRAEAKRLANLRDASIKECNARAARRRALQQQAAP